MKEKIEILSVQLLDQHRSTVTTLKKLARPLGLEFGWHYLLDLTWIIHELGSIQGKRIMDAGAGTGILQWYLADQGAEVISVDRMSRAHLPLRFRSRFRTQGLRDEDLATSYRAFMYAWRGSSKLRVKITSQARDLSKLARTRQSPGQIWIYNQDLTHMPEIKDNSIDAVVAISALEHNSPEDLKLVIAELMRVLKPGGVLLSTLGAARDQDWYHEPSRGWCYTDQSLIRMFNLPPDTPSNYDQYDQLFIELQNCAELRNNLAKFYFQSGDNGMPWGRWEPRYQTVGVCKIKV